MYTITITYKNKTETIYRTAIFYNVNGITMNSNQVYIYKYDESNKRYSYDKIMDIKITRNEYRVMKD